MVTIIVRMWVVVRPVMVLAASAVMVSAFLIVIPTVTRQGITLRSVGERGAASDQE
jgi:ABC-type uncharacterized transport system permease subunit